VGYSAADDLKVFLNRRELTTVPCWTSWILIMWRCIRWLLRS
jgi:hypothetical protein